ncbi:MAG: hypothetical protein Kow0010_00660 [Dehalococcoidia bacterium]
MTRIVFVVPHTHWDREWYLPHELFRWRLTQMVDALIDHMEANPEYRCFNLDGQSIVIDDYVQLRPENEGRLRRLIERGRVLIGPWWVQPDEFLPSAESHIRNFQLGIREARRWGGSMRVGHCADQFGHIAQMPQIMRGFGLTSACLWRGVPDSVPGWSFLWEAPDGTRIPVLYLRNSYSSGLNLPFDARELVERAREQENERQPGEPLLLMNGGDHTFFEPHVPALLHEASDGAFAFQMATLEEYEAAVLAGGIDEHVHHGELRSPDNSNVLAGVLSARMRIKQRDFEVSAALERYAEPLDLLASLHGGRDRMPALKHAWRLLLENAPHDSICGCSVDQTHREMMPRFDRAEQIARRVMDESAGDIAAGLAAPPHGALAVFRPVAGAAAPLETWAPASWTGAAIRIDGALLPVAMGPVVPGETLVERETDLRGALRLVDYLREGRYNTHRVEHVSVVLEARHLRVETIVGDGLCEPGQAEARAAVRRAMDDGAADAATLVVRTADRRPLRAVLPPAASIGVQLATGEQADPEDSDIAGGPDWIANRHYQVWLARRGFDLLDRASGSWMRGMATFVDEGDRGDEYNADIIDDAVVEPAAVELLGIEHDAVSATLRYRTFLRVPASLDEDRTRRTGTCELAIDTRVTLWAGLRRVDIRIEVDNTAEDHRLRALVPLPFAAEDAITEGHFHVATRSVAPQPWNGRSAELPPTTFPQKTFVAFERAGRGLAVFNRGLPEGEVVAFEGKQAYALTLLRCVGWLSRPDLRSRRGGAGPTIRTYDSQEPGPHAFDFAIATYEGNWGPAGIQEMAHAYAYPPVAWRIGGQRGDREDVPLLGLEGATLSAAYRSHEGGGPVVRVYNASEQDREATVTLHGSHTRAEKVDLLERPGEPLAMAEGAARLPLRRWEIATVRFG